MPTVKKLIAIGDSFLAGSELESPLSTWPALFAAEAGLEYQCLAKAGHSLQFVVRTLFESIYKESDQCFYVIHWPSAMRFEYANSINDTWVQINPNNIINPSNGSKQVQETYYRYANSLLGDKWQGLLMMYCALQALKNTSHIYSMTMVDDFHFSTDFHNPPYVEFLQKECKSAVQWFEGLPFHHWADKKVMPRGPAGIL